VFLVKLADRLHNLLTIGARPKEKRLAKIKETRHHYYQYAREHQILLPELREVLAILSTEPQ
jgi:(p)ppGpp synthase/HD superfamily hydrolase